MHYTVFDTAWGSFGFVTRNGRLLATYLPQPAGRIRRTIRAFWPEATEDRSALPAFRRQVVDYFNGKPAKFTLKLDLSDVPPFRQAARAVGKPGAARAVGGAMANNPLPLVIPCHRVLRSDGSLGGFSGPQGTKEKTRLLQLENVPGFKASPLERSPGTRHHHRRSAVAAC